MGLFLCMSTISGAVHFRRFCRTSGGCFCVRGRRARRAKSAAAYLAQARALCYTVLRVSLPPLSGPVGKPGTKPCAGACRRF